jgi:hypothetical protein
VPAIGTLSQALDNLYTTTWYHQKGSVIDQIFDAAPFWFWLKSKGKLRTEEGGRFITEPLQYAKTDNIKWIGKGSTVPLNDFEFLTISQWQWRYLVASLVRYQVDDQQNRGKMQIINYMNAKQDNVKDALVDEMETMLFGGSGAVTGSGTLETNPRPDGLQVLVPDDPTSAVTVGGIPQNSYSWWQSKALNMTGKSFATYGVSYMRTMINNQSNNRKQDRPDLIMSGQTPYEYYEDTILPAYRISNNKLGDMGFDNIQYKGIPMVWSPTCANTRMYMLNTNYFQFVYDPIMFFDMTEWKTIPNQPGDKAAQIMTACTLLTGRRRVQGVLHTIDTP